MSCGLAMIMDKVTEREEEKFYWTCLIGLKDDTKLTLQNHLAVKDQPLWLSL